MSSAKSISIPFEATGTFSKLAIDFINKNERIRPFIEEFPSIEAIGRQIARKQQQTLNRGMLVSVLKDQYLKNGIADAKDQIAKLESENTFTICCAHQPNIFTGYLYFIYKIAHTIKIAASCKLAYPDYEFVPVFYIGSEDNDIEEIGEFYFKGKRYQWQPDAKGACGRFSTESLIPMRDEILSEFGNSSAENSLRELLLSAYDGEKTLSQATQYIVNGLFGKHGVICLDADNPNLKELFRAVFKDELQYQRSYNIVSEHNVRLAKEYKIQASPREINLFYLAENIRERIDYKKGELYIKNETKEAKEHLPQLNENEVENLHPAYLSPNAILRPLYQETLLPNLVFVGGGGEIAYWSELKSLFEYYNIPYPIIELRGSLSIISDKFLNKIINIGVQKSFEPVELALIEKSQEHPAYKKLLDDISSVATYYEQLSESAGTIDPNLKISVDAQIAKIQRLHERIKTKYRSHIKRQSQDYESKRLEIYEALFPGGVLQERRENYLELVCRYKMDIIPVILEEFEAFDNSYKLIGL